MINNIYYVKILNLYIRILRQICLKVCLVLKMHKSKEAYSSFNELHNPNQIKFVEKEQIKDPLRPLILFCHKMIDNVHTETYSNFFQGLLADLTDDDFLGETSLQPVASEHQEGYVVIDAETISSEALYAEITEPNGNYTIFKLMIKNGLAFCMNGKEPINYTHLYSVLEMKKISTLKVRFLREMEEI
jgi:hypothetical protein